MSWEPDPELPEFASFRSGELFIEEVPVREVVRAYGTPVIAYSSSRLDHTARQLVTSVVGSNCELAYALKACYFPGVTRRIAAAGLRAEVMSTMEWLLACEAGFDPKQMIVNGPGKGIDALRLMLEGGTRQFNVDSESDLLRLAQAAALTHTEPSVLIRVHVVVDDGPFAGRRTKLGFDIESGEALAVCRQAASLAGIRFVGLSAHVLSRQKRGEHHMQLAEKLMHFADEVERYVSPLNVFNLGGGFDSRYLTDHADYDLPAGLNRVVEGVRQRRPNALVQFEPGRYCVADAAAAVGCIHGIKQSAGFPWLIVDAGTNVLIPTSSAWFQAVPVAPRPQALTEVGVADGICSPANVIQACARMPMPSIGEHLAIFNCGAYTTVMGESWTFPLPPVVLVEGSQVFPLFTREQACAVTGALYGLNDTRIFA